MRRVVLITVLLLAGSANAQLMPDRVRLLTSGRYADVEQVVEKEIRNDPRPNSAKLLPLCFAYGKLKRYNKVFSCLDRLEANVQAGDIAANDLQEMDRSSPLLGGLARLGSIFLGGEAVLKSSVVPFMHMIRAEALTELQQYDQAMAAAQKALESLKDVAVPFEDRASRVQCLSMLGVAQALGGQRESALKTVAELKDIGTAYPYNGVKQAKWLGVLRIYAALGDFKEADKVLRDENPSSHGLFMSFANAVGGAVGGFRQDESLTTWVDLPLEFLKLKTRMEVGEIKEAKQGFDAMLARPEARANGEIHWVLLFDRGRIAAGENDLTGAVDHWQRAIDVIEQQRSTINTEASKIGFVGDKQSVYRALIDGLFKLERQSEAFEFIERSKARALVDLLASKTDFAVASADADDVRRLLETARSEEAEALVQFGEKQTRSRNLSMRALKERSPELGSLVSVTSTPLPEIQSRIDPAEALIEYYYDDNSLYAFVLTRDKLTGIRLDSKGLDSEVRAFREAVQLPDSTSHEALGRKLYTRILQPVEPLLADVKNLVIVPHGVLHYLPFAALRTESGYLIDSYSLRFLPSAGVVRYLRATRGEGRAGILAFGNPDLDDPRLDLQFAHQEALAIVQKVPQSKALVRKEASESALRRYATGFTYLHFATHGTFNADAPLDSALMLAKDDTNDGLLTVGKLYAMRLNADMVTLSACETGLGKVANGDDVVGLTRGFLYAGASTIVASLWKVDDLATSALMTRFYDAINSGERHQALRSAQLATRQDFPHPYYWAPFQLTGSPR